MKNALWIVKQLKVNYDDYNYRDDRVVSMHLFYGTEDEVRQFVDQKNEIFFNVFLRVCKTKIKDYTRQLQELTQIDENTIPQTLIYTHRMNIDVVMTNIKNWSQKMDLNKYMSIQDHIFWEYDPIYEQFTPINFDFEDIIVKRTE